MPENEEILNQEAVTEEPVYKRIRLHPVENGEERRDITLWPETGLEGQVADLATAVNAKYSKPDGGIPKGDLASAVQTSLGKADTAIQSTDLASVATSGSYNDLTDKPNLDQKLNAKPNGSDDLIANNKIANTYIPDVILGQLKYKGTFNTAYPENPAKGDYYIYNGAEPATIGGVQYVMGDWAVYNGTSWDKIDNTDAVQSVAGKTGAVTLGTSDINGLSGALSTKLEEGTTLDGTNVLFNRTSYTVCNLNEAYMPKTLGSSYTFTGSLNKFGSQTAGVVSRQVFQLNNSMDNGGSIRIGDPYYLSAETAGKGRYIEIDGNDVQVWQNKENSPDYNSNVTEGDQLSTYREVTSLYLQDYGGDTYLCSANYQAVAKGKLISRKAFTAEDTALIKGAATFNSTATLKGAATFNSTATLKGAATFNSTAKFTDNILAHQYNKDSSTSYTTSAEVTKEITIPTISVTANGSSILKSGEVGIYWGSTRSKTWVVSTKGGSVSLDDYSAEYVARNYTKAIVTAKRSGTYGYEFYSSTFDIQTIMSDLGSSGNNVLGVSAGNRQILGRVYLDTTSGTNHYLKFS